MKENKIIHIFNDDKFIDLAIDLFESTHPDKSCYYVLKSNAENFNYIKSDKVLRLDYTNNKELEIFIEEINFNNNVVFFHALDKIKQEITVRLNNKVKKVWFIWGYDLYKMWPLLKTNLYEIHTKTYLNEKFSLKKYFLNSSIAFWIFKNSNFLLPKKGANTIANHFNTFFYKAVNKMDVVVPVIPTEFELVKNINPNLVFAPFTYGFLEGILGDSINQNLDNSKNILVGNSADYSNNHLDVFIKLSKLNLRDKKVYVPLSYGGSEEYKKFILENGKELLGENFFPITSFMSLNEYNTILLSCNVLIFNHIRQQGVGNIITLGYLGAKIFLNSTSPVYKYYKSQEIIIFEIKNLSDKSLDNKLTGLEIKKNKKIFFNLYSRNSVQEKVNQLFSTINNIKK